MVALRFRETSLGCYSWLLVAYAARQFTGFCLLQMLISAQRARRLMDHAQSEG
jgi:hypothetical protein